MYKLEYAHMREGAVRLAQFKLQRNYNGEKVQYFEIRIYAIIPSQFLCHFSLNFGLIYTYLSEIYRLSP